MKALTIIVASMMLPSASFGEEMAVGNLKQAKIDAEREAALDTIAYINQMNYAYMVMETYHNVLAIQEEYDKISLDKIDVTRIPSFTPPHGNRSMEDIVKEMLDSLKALKMTEEDFKRCQELLEDNRRRAKKDMWFKVVASVPLALKDASKVIQKNSGKGDAYTVSAQAAVTLAGDLIGGPVTAVMNYNKTLDELRTKLKDCKFTYERDKENEVHKANKNLMDAETKFAKHYTFKSTDLVIPEEALAATEVAGTEVAPVEGQQPGDAPASESSEASTVAFPENEADVPAGE